MNEKEKKEKQNELDSFSFPEPDLSIFDDPNYIEEFHKKVEEYKKQIKQYQKISLKSLFTQLD